MAAPANITRRSILQQAPLASVALLAPAALLACDAPPPVDPLERARQLWTLFAEAMDEATADHHGWYICAGYRKGFRTVQASKGGVVHAINYRVDDSTTRGFISEHHEQIMRMDC